MINKYNRTRRKLTDEERYKIGDMLKRGKTYQQVEIETGWSHSTIGRVAESLKAEGFALRTKKKPETTEPAIAETKSSEGTVSESVKVEEPVVRELSLNVIKRTIQFSGKTTGFDYEVSSEDGKVIIMDDAGEEAQMFSVDLDFLDGFIEELKDIMAESAKIKLD